MCMTKTGAGMVYDDFLSQYPLFVMHAVIKTINRYDSRKRWLGVTTININKENMKQQNAGKQP